MFKSHDEQVTVLGVCVDEPPAIGQAARLGYSSVRSGRRAIDMLRMLSFDLVIVGMTIPDIDTWDFIRRVRAGWAWQKWALVGGMISDQQEITARMFGSVKIYDVMPSGEDLTILTSNLRENAAKSVSNQRAERPFRSSAAM